MDDVTVDCLALTIRQSLRGWFVGKIIGGGIRCSLGIRGICALHGSAAS